MPTRCTLSLNLHGHQHSHVLATRSMRANQQVNLEFLFLSYGHSKLRRVSLYDTHPTLGEPRRYYYIHNIALYTETAGSKIRLAVLSYYRAAAERSKRKLCIKCSSITGFHG